MKTKLGAKRDVLFFDDKPMIIEVTIILRENSLKNEGHNNTS